MNSSVVFPPYLRAGSTVGITCPSGYVSRDKITYAAGVLTRWGYNVREGNTIANGQFYFAGTDEERRADLQLLLDDPKIDAILMGRGGYGMSRIIDSLDFTKFVQHPKWICGFSDITVLHSHILANYNIATLHSPMCGAFKPETEELGYIQVFHELLTGGHANYTTEHSAHNRAGNAEGIITGGNLSILAHLTGSVSEVNTDGKILFIEDIDEHLYHVDRLLLNLKRAGKLKHLGGLILGQFTGMQDTDRPFGQSIEEIILDKVREYDYPVCFNFPAGHEDTNYPIVLGAYHSLTVADGKGTLTLKGALV